MLGLERYIGVACKLSHERQRRTSRDPSDHGDIKAPHLSFMSGHPSSLSPRSCRGHIYANAQNGNGHLVSCSFKFVYFHKLVMIRFSCDLLHLLILRDLGSAGWLLVWTIASLVREGMQQMASHLDSQHTKVLTHSLNAGKVKADVDLNAWTWRYGMTPSACGRSCARCSRPSPAY